MALPPDYWQILTRGVAALRSLAAPLRARLDGGTLAPEEMLTLRDLEGLASRLESTTPDEWRAPWAAFSYTGQDLGVLTELIDCGGQVQSPYRDDLLTPAPLPALRALRDFLAEWNMTDYVDAGGTPTRSPPNG